MKNYKNPHRFSVLPVCILTVLALLFTTCFNPLGSKNNDEWDDGETRIVITLPGGTSNSRNLMGDSDMGYELVFEGPGGRTITKLALGGETVAVEIEPGLWSVRVRLFSPSTSTVDEARGEALSFTVQAGVPNRPSIQMRFVRISPMISAYLDTTTGTLANPASLHMDLPLTSAAWEGLLNEIHAAGKFVDLNLSACTDGGTGGILNSGAFDPDAANTAPSIIAAKGLIVEIALPDAATSIADGTWYVTTVPTFRYFDALRSFSGAGLASIGEAAFLGCTSLALTELPAGLTSIGMWAFTHCTSLTQITLPVGLTSIGLGAFLGCTNLAIVNSLTTTPPSLGTEVFSGTHPSLQIRVPAGSVTAYQAAQGWSEYASRIVAMD